MADKIKNDRQKMSVPLPGITGSPVDRKDIEELKQLLFNIKFLKIRQKLFW